MEIGTKLREARVKSGFTQEKVAEDIRVSRQTISNWETEKSYPDIVNVILLSDLYSISLDELLKGDDDLMKHLEESTNTVNSNKKLITAIILNIVIFVLFITLNVFIPENYISMAGIFCLAIISSAALLYQIVRKF